MESRYIPLTQQKYCCVPTCIQMVMYKNSIPLVSQEDIGNVLGLTVPKEDAYLFKNPRTGERPRAGWGTQIYKDEYSPNVAFQKLQIPLQMELHLIDEFGSVKDVITFLSSQQDDNSDILVCYDYGTLFDTDSTSGHVNVFDGIDIDSQLITLIDPEQKVPKYRVVHAEKLFDAMVVHTKDKSGGFWKLSKR
jgi:hypothetical protein